MNTRISEASEKKRQGLCNCAQAVISTYRDIAQIDEDTALKLGASFAGGMGNTQGTCGSLIGAGIILGLVNKGQMNSVKDMRRIMEKFQERNGATQCRVLKGLENGKVLRSCPDCVADASEFLEEILRDEEK